MNMATRKTRACILDQGLNITGRYTDKNKTGITFIVLEAGGDGQKFRQILAEALRYAAK